AVVIESCLVCATTAVTLRATAMPAVSAIRRFISSFLQKTNCDGTIGSVRRDDPPRSCRFEQKASGVSSGPPHVGPTDNRYLGFIFWGRPREARATKNQALVRVQLPAMP